jgi:hypothetical protein
MSIPHAAADLLAFIGYGGTGFSSFPFLWSDHAFAQGLELEDVYPLLPVRELEHVHALTVLNRLKLHSVFDRPLDEYIVRLYTPPSLLLPVLRNFEYKSGEVEEEDEEEEEEEEED